MINLKNYTLLVVDDDADLLDVMLLVFESHGFKVISARSGSQALEVIKNTHVDVILSDMQMPSGDGMSLLTGAKKILPQLPVLFFITGFSEISVFECVSNGARGVFTKPFNPAELVASVKAALGISDVAQAV